MAEHGEVAYYTYLLTGTDSLWALWHIPWLIFFVAISALYVLTVRGPLKKYFPGAGPVSGWKMALFLSGMFLTYVAVGSPFYYLGHLFLFSVHMTNMAILYFIVPPMVLYALPEWILAPLYEIKGLRGLLSFLNRPLFALLAFNLLFSIYHLPWMFDALMQHHMWGHLYNLMLVLAAFVNWLPILNHLQFAHKLGNLMRLVYIFVDAILLTPICAVIIFAGTLLFDSYVAVPQLYTWMTPLVDQQIGGIIMKVVQELVYIWAICYIFIGWAKKDHQVDPIPDDLIPFYPHSTASSR